MNAHDPSVAGFFLSGWYVFDNFSAHQVRWNHVTYATAEHAYQAAHFTSEYSHISHLIRSTSSPIKASLLANELAEYEDPEWALKKLAIMEEILRCKLEQHDDVREALIKSGKLVLVEQNENDDYWGSGKNGEGENMLGQLWMKLRAELTLDKD